MRINLYLKIMLHICVTIFASICQAESKKDAVVYFNEDCDAQQAMYVPIKFTQDGVRSYLRHAYNRHEYAQEILPNSMDHFIQFLDHGKKTKQTRAYIKSVVKLFSNKIKAAPCINAYTFCTMLEQIPDLLGPYFIIARTDKLDMHKAAITDILYATFLSKYDMFKTKTQEFFENLSQEIIDTLQTDLLGLGENVSVMELRQSVIRFLEISLGKLVWSPDDHKTIWESVKKISRHIEQLMDYNIIDDVNEVDDLYWTLIHRFCFFLEIARPDLPVDFYEQVKNDVASQQLLLFELEEQEPLIESKAKCLIRSVMEGHAQKLTDIS